MYDAEPPRELGHDGNHWGRKSTNSIKDTEIANIAKHARISIPDCMIWADLVCGIFCRLKPRDALDSVASKARTLARSSLLIHL